jgi:hypothetical protein
VCLAHAVYVVVWDVLEKGKSEKRKKLDSLAWVVARFFGATECGESCMTKVVVAVSRLNLRMNQTDANWCVACQIFGVAGCGWQPNSP